MYFIEISVSWFCSIFVTIKYKQLNNEVNVLFILQYHNNFQQCYFLEQQQK